MNDRVLNLLDEEFRDRPLPHGIERVAFRGGEGRFGTVVVGTRNGTHAWAWVQEPAAEDGLSASDDIQVWVAAAERAIERLDEWLE